MTGTIEGTPLATALDEQGDQLFLAGGMIDTVRSALEQEIGEDWPSKYPNLPIVLREVSRILNDAAGNLEAAVLEDRVSALTGGGSEDVRHV